MKPLKIGQTVRVSAFATVEYINDRDRAVTTAPVESFLAVIVGQAVRYTGTYQPASGGSRPWGDEDYEQASLTVSGSVTLWEVRMGMVNKPMLVRDEDLEAVTEEFLLPRQADKPRRLAEV